ncbi:unnamed protein product [Owenia fusiformis]|uniref:Uncharacterized protein n=1 Tax=Owenia fusiformis TaxID=6347 RepID=A0A8J1Y5D1_OWEFU|nr:unnamed protein product [Owenia fusiformis]
MAFKPPQRSFIRVLYDYQYTDDDGNDIEIKENEEAILVKKTNEDWWHVIRHEGDKFKKIYVPAAYVEEIPVSFQFGGKKDTDKKKNDNDSEVKKENVEPKGEPLYDQVPNEDGNTAGNMNAAPKKTKPLPKLPIAKKPRDGSGSIKDTSTVEQSKSEKEVDKYEQPSYANLEDIRATIKKQDAVDVYEGPEYANLQDIQESIKAKPPSLPALPKPGQKPIKIVGENWELHEDKETNRAFYYNTETKETSWKPPRITKKRESPKSIRAPQPPTSPKHNSALRPYGYRKEESDSGQTYFFNIYTKEKWFSSSTEEGRTYFYKENSPESAWALPEVDHQRSDSLDSSINNMEEVTKRKNNTGTNERDSRVKSFMPPEGNRLALHSINEDNQDKTSVDTIPSPFIDKPFSPVEPCSSDSDSTRGKESVSSISSSNTSNSNPGSPVLAKVGTQSGTRTPYKRHAPPIPQVPKDFIIPESDLDPNLNETKTQTEACQSQKEADQSQNEADGNIHASTNNNAADTKLKENDKSCDVRSESKHDVVSSSAKAHFQMYTDKRGNLNRTKILEHGKRVKKSWNSSYVVLNGSSLVFFKDQKAAQGSKPESSLNLVNAKVEWSSKDKSSRKHVIQVSTSDSTQYLLQTDDPIKIHDWYITICYAISHLNEDVFPSYQDPAEMQKSIDIIENSTSDKDKPPDHKPEAKFKRKASKKDRERDKVKDDSSGGSIKQNSLPDGVDPLQLSLAERKIRIRDRLLNWIMRRPSVEQLELQGIIREGVFGSHLSHLCEKEKNTVPNFVTKCMAAIEQMGLDVDGIYRVSGNLAQVQKLRFHIDQNDEYDLMEVEPDIHVLTGALKLFFRELKEPLFPYNFYDKFVTAIKMPECAQKLRIIKDLIKVLPKCNHDTIKVFFQHLNKVILSSAQNRMQTQNIAIVFGPTLLMPETDTGNLAVSMVYQNQLVEFILLEYNNIFT